MRWFHDVVVTLFALLLVGSAAQAQAATLDPAGAGTHLKITLVAESDRPMAGTSVTLALASVPAPGWHGYWQNPGDAGFPAKLDWTLPKGASATEPAYPVPGTLIVADLMNYVFERPYAPLVTLKIPAGLAVGTPLPVRLKTNYLVCSAEVCVPESADLSIDLVVGDGTITPQARARFDAWRRAVPKPLDARATYQTGNGRIRIAVPYPAGAALTKAYFYPITTGMIDYAAAQTVTQDGDRILIETNAATTPAAAGTALQGVLQIGARQGLVVTAAAGTVAASHTAPASGQSLGGASVATATLLAFAGAVLGGLILNIMPCVFPILSLKALSLARGHLDERAARHEALAYAAGVIAVCVALGGVILALRAGGTAVGWAFQLQDPQAIVVLLLLTVALALNLSGLFEIPTPAFVNRSGGAGGAFATGALAAFIATPCTGPFMGAALGAALVLPWAAALAVFAGLGIGLALPFLALGFIPALRRRLPKPGLWMETFRRILAIPMWLTAIALAWVLGHEAGVNGMAIGLVVAFGMAVLLWIAGARQARGLAIGVVLSALLLATVVAGAWLIAGQHPDAIGAPALAPGGAEPFSEARLAALQKEGRPVFVYFTADWCLTCKVNEKIAIETDATRKAFADHKVAVLIGDWTNGDPMMGRFIEAHNRAGVPLYLYYAPGVAEPRVLPQVLTSAMLVGL
ncbi:thioredoxin family protein [Sphingomonas sp. TREG-RG-20F-R18-01]|uniref:protein-disulfide reductase DsbD family protein n=1 Tax=Sphingomonas sp. TREG-RG-20F-R18-01 TaxID=2914982 RepID=UPI001F56281F|nr:thioredoxin family protein [Sphingomonas sp. TREG-RG-20F-R18-01]